MGKDLCLQPLHCPSYCSDPYSQPTCSHGKCTTVFLHIFSPTWAMRGHALLRCQTADPPVSMTASPLAEFSEIRAGTSESKAMSFSFLQFLSNVMWPEKEVTLTNSSPVSASLSGQISWTISWAWPMRDFPLLDLFSLSIPNLTVLWSQNVVCVLTLTLKYALTLHIHVLTSTQPAYKHWKSLLTLYWEDRIKHYKSDVRQNKVTLSLPQCSIAHIIILCYHPRISCLQWFSNLLSPLLSQYTKPRWTQSSYYVAHQFISLMTSCFLLFNFSLKYGSPNCIVSWRDHKIVTVWF